MYAFPGKVGLPKQRGSGSTVSCMIRLKTFSLGFDVVLLVCFSFLRLGNLGCSLDWPQIHYVSEDGFELLMLLPTPPAPPCPACVFCFSPFITSVAFLL